MPKSYFIPKLHGSQKAIGQTINELFNACLIERKNNPEAIVVACGCFCEFRQDNIDNLINAEIIIGNKNKSKITKYIKEYEDIVNGLNGVNLSKEEFAKKADEYATHKVKRDFEQGFQALEYKLNTVGSSRGDYPFVTFTFGLGQEKFQKMATIAMLKVRKGGQGAPGFKKAVLFPKLVFLYDENIHGEGKPCEDLFNAAIDCSSKAQYPDYLSMSGNGYIASMYKKYGKVISPMGCRAFLSPYWERGGQKPADNNDVPVFVGRLQYR